MLAFPQPVIALWTKHPGDLLGEAITFLTHGPVEHAGWLLSDGQTIAEAYWPRVRQRAVLEAEKSSIRLFTLAGMTPELAAKFERYFKMASDPKFAEDYSFQGLVGYALNLTPPNEQAVFCSEWNMQTVHKVVPELLPLVRCDDWKVSPRDLLISPRLLEISWAEVGADVNHEVNP